MSAVEGQCCDFCALPVAKSFWRGHAEPTEGPVYCCFGCRFADAVTASDGDEGEARRLLTRLGIAIFLSMNVMVFTLVLWSYDVYAIDTTQAIPRTLAELLRSLCLLFTVPVLFLLGKPILESAVSDTKRGVISTDLLVLTGVVASFVYSLTSVLTGEGSTYFEVGCMVLVMITLGRWLEATGRLKATNALDELQQLLPEHVQLLRDGQEDVVPIADVAVGDCLLIRPTERIPTDGVLVDLEAVIDEQVITGESWPVTKHAGDPIVGGSLNLDGPIRLQVTAKPSAGTLARLIETVREARLARGRYQRQADRIAGWFLPIVAVIAMIALVGHGLASGWGDGLMASLAVVLVACPCALGLATPLAVWTSLEAAAQRRVIFRSGEALERLADVKAFRFDKTGTLTTGQPQLHRIVMDRGTSQSQILCRTYSLAQSSTHVFSQTLANSLASKATPIVTADLRDHPGLGVTGNVTDGGCGPTCIALGSERLMSQCEFVIPNRLQSERDQQQAAGRPLVFVGWNGLVRGVFVFEESLRPEARQAIESCIDLGRDVAVITGDHESRGRVLADQLGVPVFAEMLPQQKAERVEADQSRWGSVAVVGDGVNDAPAMTVADVGIAMGCGTDVTRESAEVCLTGDDLTRIPWALDLSQETVKTIRRNLAWAFGYNSAGVVIAASGWLHPAIAAGLMLVSSVVVIANSLKLNRFAEARPHSSRASDQQGWPVPVRAPSPASPAEPLVLAEERT